MGFKEQFCEGSEFDADTNAFEVQLCYGLELLFANYQQDYDYTVLFEFHDDVGLVINPNDPTALSFYQVKSYASDIAFSNLIRRPKIKGSDRTKYSVIEKLYENIVKFEDLVKSVEVVSSTHCSSPKTPSTILHKDRFTFDELADEDKEIIVGLLSERFSDKNIDEGCLAKIAFTKTLLSKDGYLDIVKGKIHTFLVEVSGHQDQPLDTLVSTIKEICRRKNNAKVNPSSDSYEEAIKKKGVSKSELNEWIATAKSYDKAPEWSVVLTELQNMPVRERITLKTTWDTYKTEVLNNGDARIKKLRREISQTIRANPMLDNETLNQCNERIGNELSSNDNVKNLNVDSQKLKVAIIYELWEILQESEATELQDVNSKFEN